MTAGPIKLVHPPRIADARAAIRHVFVRDLVLSCSIGVHAHEHEADQRVRINVDLAVHEEPVDDSITNVVCYEKITDRIRDLAASSHINLVETLAEKIAGVCLVNPRVRSARVRVEKLDVYEDAASVGVEIERFNPDR